ncbi:MAG: hypothetical protein V4577_00980 [Bacteroidota bacterium]
MKKVTKTVLAEKVEPCAEMQVIHQLSKKISLHYKVFDNSHGRVNKMPFGINHEPGCF